MASTNPWPPTASVPATISTLARAANKEAGRPTPKVSARWVDSLRQLADLRATLIRVSPTGAYAPSSYVKARGFVVLAHGVLEAYLEGIALEVVDSSIKNFNLDGRARTSLLALLGYAHDGTVPVSYSGGPWGVREALKASRQTLRNWTETNNGIKEKDLLRLLLPTGLKESDMGVAWLSDMSDLGSLRGRVAHHGMAPGAAHPIDPKDAVDHVEKVLPTLCRLDSKLVLLRDE